MVKLIILEIYGDFEHGFAVNLEVKKDQARSYSCLKGKLPKNPDLLNQYRQWQALYRNLETLYRPLKDKPGQITNYSQKPEAFAACNLAAEVLEETMNNWLKSANSFRLVENELCQHLKSSNNVRVILRTNNSWLQRLPWHLWNLPSVTASEIVLSIPQYEVVEKPVPLPPKDKVKILAVFGPGMEPESERLALKEAGNAEIKILQEPLLEELNDELWERGCDILFFAGHSSSNSDGQDGEIQINKNYTLTIGKLKYSLKKAVNKGLRLAIFNSCDGLGLAYQLAEGEAIYLPFIIIMREPVPDDVAPKFLRYFLEEYAKTGTSLDNALRDARQRLQGLEQDYPCATWLPVICQSSEEIPPTWQELLNERKIARLPKIDWRGFVRVLTVSVLVTSLVMGVRFFGILQPSELHAYDRMMQMRSDEPQDDRILIITNDDADIQYQINKRMEGGRQSISDPALASLLKKLEKFEPITIGLDIYHPEPFTPSDLASRIQKDKRFFVICKIPFLNEDKHGFPPPVEIPKERWGFSDVVKDSDRIVRRHLLTMLPSEPKSKCTPTNSFSLLVAAHYLDAKGIQSTRTPEKQELQIGTVVIKKLTAHTSGYQGVDANGEQVLLNYRIAGGSPNNIATQISLSDIIEDRIPSESVNNLKKRIVLIGTTARTFKDFELIPFGEEIPGVVLQAQMISQILSAVLDRNRPLIWWWPEWVAGLWIWGWSLLAGILALYCREQPLRLLVVGIVQIAAVFGICFSVFTQAGWIPFIPPILALVITKVVVVWWLSPQYITRSKSKFLNSEW